MASNSEHNPAGEPDHRPNSLPIDLTPFRKGTELSGFIVGNRWPASTLEWTQTLVALVRVACIPGMLSHSTIFEVREDLPESPRPESVGIFFSLGPVTDEETLRATSFVAPPPALIMLHPPSETSPSLPECGDTASGTILLPGIPHLGLDHRAGWAETEPDGTIVSMRAQCAVDPIQDPDTAVLAMLLAA